MTYKMVSNTMIIGNRVYEIDKFNTVYEYEKDTMKFLRIYNLEVILKEYFFESDGE